MQHVSIAKYQAQQASTERARQALTALRNSSSGMAVHVAEVGGAGLAGLIDAKFGTGTATLPAFLALIAGWWMKMPWLMSLGAGLLSPVAYRLGQGAYAALPDMSATMKQAA